MANKKSTETASVIALATIYRDGQTVRGKIPASVARALKAGDGDVLAFERLPGGSVVVRKATVAERKTGAKGRRK